MFKKEEMSFMKKREKKYKDPSSGGFVVHAMDVGSFMKGVTVSANFLLSPSIKFHYCFHSCQMSICFCLWFVYGSRVNRY